MGLPFRHLREGTIIDALVRHRRVTDRHLERIIAELENTGFIRIAKVYRALRMMLNDGCSTPAPLPPPLPPTPPRKPGFAMRIPREPVFTGAVPRSIGRRLEREV